MNTKKLILLFLFIPLVFTFSSSAQDITWYSIEQDIDSGKYIYKKNPSLVPISSKYNEKYDFIRLQLEKDIYYFKPTRKGNPWAITKEKILFENSFYIKAENREKGRKNNRKKVYEKIAKIFTKEKILDFIKKNGINNTNFFEGQELIEAYVICQSCVTVKRDGGNLYYHDGKLFKVSDDNLERFFKDKPNAYPKTHPVFLIIFDNDSQIYEDEENYVIRITPQDLIDIPPSPDIKISENILKLANYIVNELDNNLITESDKGPKFFEEEGKNKANNGDFEGALVSFNKAIELAEDPWSDLFRGRGVVKKAIGDCNAAIEDLKIALELLEGSNDEVYVNESSKLILLDLAYCKLFNENPDTYGAIFDCNEVIKLDPNSARAFGLRGIAKVTINDVKGACSDVKNASILGDNRYEKQLSPLCNN